MPPRKVPKVKLAPKPKKRIKPYADERKRDERDLRILELLDHGVPALRICSQYRGLTKNYIEKLQEEAKG